MFASKLIVTLTIGLIGTCVAGLDVISSDAGQAVFVSVIVLFVTGIIAGWIGRSASRAVGVVVGSLMGWAILFLVDLWGLAGTFFNTGAGYQEIAGLWPLVVGIFIIHLAAELVGYAAGATLGNNVTSGRVPR